MRMLASETMPATAQIMLLMCRLAACSFCRTSPHWSHGVNVLVQNVELLSTGILLQQLARHLPLCCQHNSIFREDTDSCACMRDSLESIFDLIKTSLWGEDGCLRFG